MAKKDKDENIENQELQNEEVNSEAPLESENTSSQTPADIDMGDGIPADTEAAPSSDDLFAAMDEAVKTGENEFFANTNDSAVSLDSDIDSAAEQAEEQPVTVQAVKFASFEDEAKPETEQNKNLDILMDIKLQLTVELGRTELPVKQVLELTRGSIVELQKIAGEPVELYANGKLVAQGEVVVIEDNFGLRITSITDPEDRLKGL